MNKYNKIMERLTVSDEMKERLIEGIDKTEVKNTRILRTAAVRRYLSIAACLVLIIVGALIVKNAAGEDPITTGGETGGDTVAPGDRTPWGSEIYKTADELSKAAGFTISDLEDLPFTPTGTVYQKYQDGIAEITYMNGEEDNVCYRVSRGDEDNSGDYNEYYNEIEMGIGGKVCTLKGDGDLIFCVLYAENGFSYSITSTGGLTLAQTEKLIK